MPKARVSRGKLLYGSDWGYGYGDGYDFGTTLKGTRGISGSRHSTPLFKAL